MYALTEETFRVAQYNCKRNGTHLTALITTPEPHLVVVVAAQIKASGPIGSEVRYVSWAMNLTEDPSECFNSGHWGFESLDAAYRDALGRAV